MESPSVARTIWGDVAGTCTCSATRRKLSEAQSGRLRVRGKDGVHTDPGFLALQLLMDSFLPE